MSDRQHAPNCTGCKKEARHPDDTVTRHTHQLATPEEVERQHCEAVARECLAIEDGAATTTELCRYLADLLMRERAGLLARAEAAEWLAQRYAAQSAVMAAGQCDGANGVVLPGVYQFVRVGGPGSTSETCGRCGKHVSRHYGGTQYRCHSLRDDEQADEVFGGRADLHAKLATADNRIADQARALDAAQRRGDALAAKLSAEEARRCFECGGRCRDGGCEATFTIARAEKAEAERDAYRKAKAENDERFQLAAEEQRARAEAAKREVRRLDSVIADHAVAMRVLGEERDDLRAKLAAADNRIADQARALDAAQRRGDALAAKLSAEEAAAAQMRAALEAVSGPRWESEATWYKVRAALATDTGRGYLSPEQVAQAGAAARDAALEEAADTADEVAAALEGDSAEQAGAGAAADAIRALKAGTTLDLAEQSLEVAARTSLPRALTALEAAEALAVAVADLAGGKCYCIHADEDHSRSECPRCSDARDALASFRKART